MLVRHWNADLYAQARLTGLPLLFLYIPGTPDDFWARSRALEAVMRSACTLVTAGLTELLRPTVYMNSCQIRDLSLLGAAMSRLNSKENCLWAGLRKVPVASPVTLVVSPSRPPLPHILLLVRQEKEAISQTTCRAWK